MDPFSGRTEIQTGFFLAGRPDGNRPIVCIRRRWEDNIKMYIQEIGCDDVERIDLAQVRYKLRDVVNTVMNIMTP
jgi:hypothetical protein